MQRDTLALLPEILVLAGGVIVLLAGSFLPRDRQGVTRSVAIVALLLAAAAAVAGMTSPAMTIFEGGFAVDVATGAARIIIPLATILVLVLGVEELGGSARESETYSLMMLSALGAIAMAGANDLLVLAAGYLLASIPLYALVGMSRSPGAAEAALKTYLIGAIMGIALLLGVTILYGVGASTSYSELRSTLGDAPPAAVLAGIVGVVAGLMFKAGGVPGHFWVPDATQASGTTVAAFLTSVPKLGALIAAYRFFEMLPDGSGSGAVGWPLLVAIVATASMTLGNLAAFWQTDVRRLLGWSTVSQVGYLLLPVAVAGNADLALPSLLLYLAGYAASNITAFAVVAALPARRSIEDYRGAAAAHPWLAGALVVSLLGLAGTPPTAVFVGKLTTFSAAWDGGFAWLVVVAAINTVASLFYYLRWLAPILSRGRGDVEAPVSEPSWAARAAVTGALAVLVIGIAAGPILTAFGTTLLG
ncbi:NADH-quinone oxidoreductase subunit N [Marisediminicola sp. UYEF4]|uniref:NADH-quinone oxidoreductase subunit N n=1 Tax=Marisediminicola sp. UYEF4 TaxID=1756384 RepID=UPI0033918433